MEKAKTVKDNRLLAIMATVLLALLMISQLSLASSYSNSSFLYDGSYKDSLDDNDQDSNAVTEFNPDFIHASYDYEQNIVSSWSYSDLSIAYIEKQIQSYSIRAPPLFS